MAPKLRQFSRPAGADDSTHPFSERKYLAVRIHISELQANDYTHPISRRHVYIHPAVRIYTYSSTLCRVDIAPRESDKHEVTRQRTTMPIHTILIQTNTHTRSRVCTQTVTNIHTALPEQVAVLRALGQDQDTVGTEQPRHLARPAGARRAQAVVVGLGVCCRVGVANLNASHCRYTPRS